MCIRDSGNSLHAEVEKATGEALEAAKI